MTETFLVPAEMAESIKLLIVPHSNSACCTSSYQIHNTKLRPAISREAAPFIYAAFSFLALWPYTNPLHWLLLIHTNSQRTRQCRQRGTELVNVVGKGLK